MNQFLGGAIMMAFATIGLFFWRFWKKSGDRFYIMFATAFWVFALNQLIQISNPLMTNPALPLYYLVRLLAFLLILLAIIDKNYSR